MPSRIIAQPPDEAHAPVGEGVQVEVDVLRAADELRRGQVPGAHDVVDLVVALVADAASGPATT